jgi:hypothetical protein
VSEEGGGRAPDASPHGPIARQMARLAIRTYGMRGYRWHGGTDLSEQGPADVEDRQESSDDAGQDVSVTESDGVRLVRRPLSTIRFDADSAGRKESEK